MIDTIKITINITDVPFAYDQFLLNLKLNTSKKNQDNDFNITTVQRLDYGTFNGRGCSDFREGFLPILHVFP